MIPALQSHPRDPEGAWSRRHYSHCADFALALELRGWSRHFRELHSARTLQPGQSHSLGGAEDVRAMLSAQVDWRGVMAGVAGGALSPAKCGTAPYDRAVQTPHKFSVCYQKLMYVKKLFISSSPKNSGFIYKVLLCGFNIVFSGNASNSVNQGEIVLCFIIIETLPGDACHFRKSQHQCQFHSCIWVANKTLCHTHAFLL